MGEECALSAEGEGAEPGLESGLARLQPRLLRHLTRSHRRVEGLEPADLAQEVNARALRYRASFEPGRALWPWLVRMAERVVSDQRARRRDEAACDVEQAPDARRDPREALDARDALALGLAALDQREREVLLDFHQRGRSVRQIARAHGLPEGTVKSHLHRARRRLAERLDAERPDA